MKDGRRRSSVFGTSIASEVVVVGRAPELAAFLPEDHTRLDPFDVGRISTSATTVIMDLRDVGLDVVSSWRSYRQTSISVLILLGAEPIGEDTLERLGVDDVIVVPADIGPATRRRLERSFELGRMRFAVSFAEQAFEELANGMSVADASEPGAPLVDVSPAYERLTQYEKPEVLGRRAHFLVRTEDAEEPAVQSLERAVRERRRATEIVRSYKKDGTMFWSEVTTFPVLAGGVPTRWVVGVQHDVTRLVQTQAAIDKLYRLNVEQRTFDHAILDGVDAGIIATDRRGLITFANRGGRELLQLDTSIVGADVAEVLGFLWKPGDLLGEEPRCLLSHPYVTSDGSELDLEVVLSRSIGVNDGRAGYFFIFRDVREDKRREAEHRRFERLAAMGTMVAGFAHEVRNPVAALRSLAEEMGEELTSAGLKLPHAGRMLRVLERIERLVRTSLQFGRPAAPRRAAHRPWVICNSALSGVAPRMAGKSEELRVEMEPELPDAFVDDGQLVQALVILLENAFDAVGTPRGVQLRVTRIRSTETEVSPRKSSPPPVALGIRFDVIDHGPGIAPGDISRIFDPFYTTKAAGTGLGLSIAQQIVNENGGRLEVSSARGGPTTFTIVIPALEE